MTAGRIVWYYLYCIYYTEVIEKMLHCPRCGAKLNISLVLSNGEDSPSSLIKTQPTTFRVRNATFRINFQSYSLSDNDVIVAAKSEEPGTIQKFYVQLADGGGKVQEYPIKQVVRKALKTKYPEKFTEKGFTAHRARDILTKLGFIVKQRY